MRLLKRKPSTAHKVPQAGALDTRAIPRMREDKRGNATAERKRMMRTIEKADIAALEPMLCSIQAAIKILGRSERSIIDMISRGEIEAVKSDRRTLVVVDSPKRYVAKLPNAKGTLIVADGSSTPSPRPLNTLSD